MEKEKGDFHIVVLSLLILIFALGSGFASVLAFLFYYVLLPLDELGQEERKRHENRGVNP